MKTIYLVVALTLAVVLSGCAISQNVDQAHIPNAAKLCVIENEGVREGFLPELLGVLDEKGIGYVVTGKHAASNGCEWTLTYTARWSWDLAIYMSYAEIKVFKNGVLDGQAVYDSRGGAANMAKFIDAEPKIRELVEELMQREQDVGKVANRNASQLRAVSAEDKEDCEFIKSITKGAGGSGDVSNHLETAMDKALDDAESAGADSYFIADVSTTSTGASVVLEALKCNDGKANSTVKSGDTYNYNVNATGEDPYEAIKRNKTSRQDFSISKSRSSVSRFPSSSDVPRSSKKVFTDDNEGIPNQYPPPIDTTPTILGQKSH